MGAATAEKTDRIDRGLALWRERRDEIRELGGGLWSVPSSGSGGREYIVDVEMRLCDCADKRFGAGPDELCKHGWAAVLEMMS